MNMRGKPEDHRLGEDKGEGHQ